MNNKNLIIILSAIIVVLIICTGLMFFNNLINAEIEYEVYTVNGTGTTIEIPVNSKIVETDELINITDEHVNVLIYKDVNESKNASMDANTDMDEKLNKETKELIQVFAHDKETRNHIIESIKFGKAMKNDEEEATGEVVEETHVEVEETPVEVEKTNNNYEIGEQPDGGYVDPTGNSWPSYDAYLYTHNHPSG